MKGIKFLILFYFIFNPLFSEEFIGKAQVIDGDTIKIGKEKIRLFGIDAPEKKQKCKKIYLSFLIFNFQKDYNCGQISKKALQEKIKKKRN